MISDEQYEELLRRGGTSGPATNGLIDWDAGSERAAWVEENAVPWWKALLEGVRSDGLIVQCYVGHDEHDHRQRLACARLLHPLLGTADWRPDTASCQAAVEVWRQLASERGRWLDRPALRSEEGLADDYRRLLADGKVEMPLVSSPVAEAMSEERRHQDRERIEPWLFQMSERARRDGFTITSTVNINSHIRDGEGFVTKVASIVLLDPELGLTSRELDFLLDRRNKPASIAPASRPPVMDDEHVRTLADLGDYLDLLRTGYGCGEDDPIAERYAAWCELMSARAAEDGLTIRCEMVGEGMHNRYPHAIAFLNLPSGERPPETPHFYAPWGTGAQRRESLGERLEHEWGAILVRARERVEADLDRVSPDWRRTHKAHD